MVMSLLDKPRVIVVDFVRTMPTREQFLNPKSEGTHTVFVDGGGPHMDEIVRVAMQHKEAGVSRFSYGPGLCNGRWETWDGRDVIIIEPAGVTHIDDYLRVQYALKTSADQMFSVLPAYDLQTKKTVYSEVLLNSSGILSKIDLGAFFRNKSDLELESAITSEAFRQTSLIHEGLMTSTGQSVPFGINVSARELANPAGLMSSLRELHANYGNLKRFYTIEVVEHAPASDLAALREAVLEIQSMGARVSIDDFSHGYAGFDWLVNIPFNELKIDKEIIQSITVGNPVNKSLVTALLGWCASSGVDVVAEGIETEDQLNVLKSLGFTQGQGFYFSPKVPLSEFVFEL